MNPISQILVKAQQDLKRETKVLTTAGRPASKSAHAKSMGLTTLKTARAKSDGDAGLIESMVVRIGIGDAGTRAVLRSEKLTAPKNLRTVR